MKINSQLSLSDKTYQLIKKDIVTCLLPPGQFIAQAELADSYKVGVTPVREALRQLAQEGFVQSIPRIGFIVSPITQKDIEEIFDLRLILEPASVRLAAERGSDEVLQHILKISDFTYTYKDHESYSIFLQKNLEFHIAIAGLTSNGRLVNQISRIMDELNRVFHLGLDLKDSGEEMRRDHLALINALCSRDADQAEKLTREEIQRSRARVLEALSLIPSSPLPLSPLIHKVGFYPQNKFLNEENIT